MPLRFEAVVGVPHTYLLFNEWPSYQNYVSADVAHGGWLSAHADKAHATPFEFVPAGQGVGDGEYSLVNKDNGMYALPAPLPFFIEHGGCGCKQSTGRSVD
jgi:hypothetical protein